MAAPVAELVDGTGNVTCFITLVACGTPLRVPCSTSPVRRFLLPLDFWTLILIVSRIHVCVFGLKLKIMYCTVQVHTWILKVTRARVYLFWVNEKSKNCWIKTKEKSKLRLFVLESTVQLIYDAAYENEKHLIGALHTCIFKLNIQSASILSSSLVVSFS